MPQRLAITHANLVLEDEILEDGSVLIADGLIEDYGPCMTVDTSSADAVIDADHVMYLMPGLIDTHNDGLEAEVNPRPRAGLPPEFALHNYERRSIAAGVTTSFHAMAFMNMARNHRTVDDAGVRTRLIRDYRETSPIDHQVLHRLDVWTPEGIAPLMDSMRQFPVQTLSLNDHTPGQGQYRDLEAFKKMLQAYRADDPTFDADAELQRRIDERANDTETIPAVYAKVQDERERQTFIIASHDDDSPEKVELMHGMGSTIAEFPITNEAARKARDLGMWTTVGAPNIVRGGSTSGNSDAAELVRLGLADIICADYHAPSMLLSVFKLADAGDCALVEAVQKVTANAAAAFEMTDRGRIQRGLRADLALVELVDGRPLVHATISRGQPVYATERAQVTRTRELVATA